MSSVSKRVSILVLTVSFSLYSFSSANAAQHKWGAAYLNWSGARLDSSSTVSQVIQPQVLSANTYWSSGWAWDNISDGGYGGIQSKGILADGQISDLAIFSIWNATKAIPGEGAGCTNFGGEGLGMSCRIPIELVAGNKYKITFGVDLNKGRDWWFATIGDEAIGTTRVIGWIQNTSSDAYAKNWYNFIEYWGQAVPCDAVGEATAKFYVPTSTNPDVEFYNPTFSRPQNPCVMSAADTPPLGTIGDVVMRFGGNYQAPSTQNMPFVEVKAIRELRQEIADKAAADKLEANTKPTRQPKLKSISCIKGKLTKKVTGTNPKCPAGFKQK